MLPRMLDAAHCACLSTAEQPPGQPGSFLCDVACSLVPDERCSYSYFVVAVGNDYSGHQGHILDT